MRITPTTISLCLLAAVSGCSDYRSGPESDVASSGTAPHTDSAEGTISRFRAADPSMERYFNESFGYVVFPKITKGALGVGAAHGEAGVVYEHGRPIGSSEVTQITLGVQAGGQTYSEIIFFKDYARLKIFKDGEFEFSANATAIAAESGAGKANDYEEGVAVFYLPRGGLMFEASIGGQKFTYHPYP